MTDKFFQVLELSKRSISFWLSLWEEESGGFRFATHQPTTLMATAYTILGLEFANGLSQLSQPQKEKIADFIIAGSRPDGSFEDSKFMLEDVLSKDHDFAYFQEETTTFCQQALHALGYPPPPPRIYDDGRDTPEGLIKFCESLPWQNAWLDSNPVMFILSQLCHDVERHQKTKILKTIDAALDWLDAHQSPETGLWLGPHKVSLTNAMAATFHFTFFYIYRNRPVLYVERIIDSCLRLQEPHGLFSGNKIGQTCLDYDALDLLAKASLVTDYRFQDVQLAMARAFEALLGLHNEDGGFADCKEQVMYFNGRRARLLRNIGLSQLAPSFKRLPTQGTYNVCWKLLSCNSSQSNSFSTWFRLLSLCLASQQQWLDHSSSQKLIFRSLPFLGYHKTEISRNV